MPVRRFLFASLLSLLTQAAAATLSITPVTLEINPQRQLMAVTTLTNQGTTPIEFNAALMRWTQQDGQDVTVPTRDAAVNPVRFTIAPGRSQVVRIGLRTRPSALQVTYRLLLRQIAQSAPAPTPGTDQVQAAIVPTYVFSLPLFVTQPSAQENVKASLERTAGGLTLVLNNTGTAHATYRNMTTLLNSEALNLGSVYVLPGSTMRVSLPPTLSTAKTLVIHSTDRAQQDHIETLDVPTP
ncbi:molecular chaperone [Deinococcus psychrotolerans]|uniref:Molecular chaperone n=1 Tax=Deinococcus psychrotolerans TaxID=2489213 RepID=A0A3G8YGR6_9DEIO|nr:fimbria/pilus periplasmic chaperone [Deinococcus psychrotolerans]AZI44135.1 molecular chaperone [Deinococcus psychrotolerans]